MLWSDTGKTKEDAAKIVAEALKNDGWKDVSVGAVAVKDVSGGGGSQTFKVSAEGAEPPAVALHTRNTDLVNELTAARTEAVAKLLAASGVAPARLAQGKDWFVEPWDGEPFPWGSPERDDSLLARPPKCSTEGCHYWASVRKGNVWLFGGYFCCLMCAGKNKGKPEEHDEVGFLLPCQKQAYSAHAPIEWAEHPYARWEEIGALMAKVHKNSPEWYEGFRGELCRQLPAIKDISPASMYWWWGRQTALASEFSDEGYRLWASEEYRVYQPVTEAARRVVTCHGDFQHGNVLHTSAGELKVIDFENSLACCAAMDVCWTFATWCTNPQASREEQKRFIRGYLTEAGYPSDTESVHAFDTDIQIFSLTLPGAVASNIIPRKEGPFVKGSPTVRRLCAEVASTYRADAVFRAEVDATPESPGLVPWSPHQGLQSYIARHPDYTNDLSMREIDAAMRGEALESAQTFEGKTGQTDPP